MVTLLWIKKRKNQSTLSTCCICEKVFKDDEVVNIDELPFCKTHYHYFLKHSWSELQVKRASSKNSDGAMEIYNNKHLLLENKILSFIKTDYEEQGGEIISVFKLYCPEEFFEVANNLIDK